MADPEGAVCPVPVNATVCGLPLALSLIDRVPVRVPAAVGVNATASEHVPPAATELPQELVNTKSELAVVPPLVMPAALIVRAADPVFDKVTVCAELVVCTVCAPKVNDGGVNDTTGEFPEEPGGGDDELPPLQPSCTMSLSAPHAATSAKPTLSPRIG